MNNIYGLSLLARPPLKNTIEQLHPLPSILNHITEALGSGGLWIPISR